MSTHANEVCRETRHTDPRDAGATHIDAIVLEAEFEAGRRCELQVPLSQSTLLCLVFAARVALDGACGEVVRDELLAFERWCSQHAGFGPETRKLIAQRCAAARDPSSRRLDGKH